MSQFVKKHSELAQDAAASEGHATPVGEGNPDLELRVDAPHRVRPAESASSAPSSDPELPLQPDAALHSVSGEIDLTRGLRTGEPAPKDFADRSAFGHVMGSDDPLSSLHDERLLLRATQIADHYRKKYAELDRREQRLTAQLALLDRERRNVRLWVGQFDLQVQDRESALQNREAVIADREAALRRSEQELEDRIQCLRDQEAQIVEERIDAIALAEQGFEERLLEVRRREDSLIAERVEEINKAAHELQEQRLDIERCRQELVEQKARHATELQALRQRLEEEHAERLHQIAVAADAADQECARGNVELREERARLLSEIDESREQLAQARAQHDAELKRERALLESRIRFQQEHLQKARRELESAQNDFHLEKQQIKSRLIADEAEIAMRREQLSRLRQIFEEREQSLLRDQDTLAKARSQLQDLAEQEKHNLLNERTAWSRDREAQQAELRRQQALLAEQAASLDVRHQRLDTLREELEVTHRETLELRVAVEEALAQVSQAEDPDTARARVEGARQALAEQFRLSRQALLQHREELEHLQLQFQRQRDDFLEERETLTAWMADRDEQLRIREAELRQERETYEAREQAWIELRDGWHREKLEAEAVIRDLLRQLADRTATNAG